MKFTFSLRVWIIWSKFWLYWDQEGPIIWNSQEEFNQMNKSNLDSNSMKKTKARVSYGVTHSPPCGSHLNLNFSHGRDENILLPQSFIKHAKFLLALAFLHICQLEKLTSLLFWWEKDKNQSPGDFIGVLAACVFGCLFHPLGVKTSPIQNRCDSLGMAHWTPYCL